MENRLDKLTLRYGIPIEFHSYEGLGHGFGLGTGTAAEGWINDIVGVLFAGAIFGFVPWLFFRFISTFFKIGKDLRGAGKTALSLQFCRNMRKFDPDFSTEYFRDKSLSLLKLMLYSRNPQELTVCQCDKPIPEKLREIVDTTYFNFGVNKYSIKDGACYVSLTFYMDSLHYLWEMSFTN